MPENALIHHAVLRRTPNLLLDHRGADRRLLRPIPGDARPVYDPPHFYGATPRQEAFDVVCRAFYCIPVRPMEWLKVKDVYIVRSDDWVAVGRRREELTGAMRRDTFVSIGSEWLLRGRCACSTLPLDQPLTDYDGNPVDALATAEWVVAVLCALEAFVPELRTFRSAKSPANDIGALAHIA